jgi:hypothetical protein
VFFNKLSFIKGAVQSLESFRTTQIGGLGMGMFIWSGCDGWTGISNNLQLMRDLNDLAYFQITLLAKQAPWLMPCYIDMHKAVQ